MIFHRESLLGSLRSSGRKSNHFELLSDIGVPAAETVKTTFTVSVDLGDLGVKELLST